ncbi:MAG: glycoside hydrolase, partial [Tannerella sp.]|nr:glycoside hydrolase [Tannerella sp.]
KAFSQHDGLTSVPLTFEPYGAVFVVFNERIPVTEQGMAEKNDLDYRPVMEITGPWTVNFDPRRGGPESVVFPELTDWTKHSDERIKYYSGAAVYHKTFSIDFVPEKDKSYYLQLESVKDAGIAVVTVNGKDRGVVWTKPFRVDVGGDLRTGDNTIEIKVVNSWYNRVAGDEISSGNNRYTSTNIVLTKEFKGVRINLEPSGLIGPVRIMEGS